MQQMHSVRLTLPIDALAPAQRVPGFCAVDLAQQILYREVGQYSNHTVGRFSVSGLVGGEGRHTVSFAKRSERSMMGQCCSFILMRIKSLEMFLKT